MVKDGKRDLTCIRSLKIRVCMKRFSGFMQFLLLLSNRTCQTHVALMYMLEYSLILLISLMRVSKNQRHILASRVPIPFCVTISLQLLLASNTVLFYPHELWGRRWCWSLFASDHRTSSGFHRCP
jgi:hypothetical protein